ncbi:hypothetical protein EGW08_013331 [Elysia chlorotica]|uniref:G-protein coupled receptors family 1 profile domain-containing protein n=1 Tax=Elysia chlorotica TaxID=188477 RepID=A0A3S0ZHC2_ELYCH|nr:hypothetical protein EGW08_013331 [Elysia chlorotica]
MELFGNPSSTPRVASIVDRDNQLTTGVPTCGYNTTSGGDGGAANMNAQMRYVDLYMNIVLPFALSVFTLCTNVINMAVQVKQGVNSCVSLCLFCISTTDFLTTFTGFCALPPKIMMYLYQRPGFDPFAFYFHMVYTCAILYDVSNTLTAFLSLERCLCVCLPLKFKDMFTFRRVVTVIVCIYLMCFGLVMPHFLSSGFQVRSSGNSTYLALWLSADRAGCGCLHRCCSLLPDNSCHDRGVCLHVPHDRLA